MRLRDRFLFEQQAQLAKDAALPDPADAYRALVETLDAEDEEHAIDSPPGAVPTDRPERAA
jgi:hypothetical protein